MWTVVYIAPTFSLANKIKEALLEEGLMVDLRPTRASGDIDKCSFEILVLSSEAEEANEIINKILVT